MEAAGLSDAQRRAFERDGYVRLGLVATIEEVEGLRRRVDDLMLGRVLVPEMQFQLDSTTGRYRDLPWRDTRWQGPRLDYRKILDLERDPVFRAYLRHPRFRAITRELVGERVSVFRAMFMNKPAGRGTVLPYHQDGGTQWNLDRERFVTVWTALDDATMDKGCLQVVPGTHRLGLLSPEGHTIAEAEEAVHCPAERAVFLEAAAGEAILMHNYLVHRSGVNRTADPRRALSVVYMDGETRRTPDGASFPPVFGLGVEIPEEHPS